MSVIIPSLRAAVAVPGWAKNELWRSARAVPSLDLRFADNKSLVDSVTGASLVTFTRASSGTFVGSDGVLQTAVTDVPRFDHNPTTGESLGLLVEEQRTNLVLQSNQFDTTWTNSNSSETASSGTAPDGTNTAWELKDTVDGSAVIHSINQTVSFTSGLAYTFSVWVKSGTLSLVGLQLPASGFTTSLASRYNLATGTVASTPAGTTTAIQAFSNGWYRCSLTATATATASGAVNFRTAVGGNVSYQGDGTGTILVWGAQLEAGAFPTSYIPTTAAAVTRSADVASITGSAFSSWYRQDEGTVFAEYAGQNGGRTFMADDGTTNNRFENRITANTSQLSSWSANIQVISALFAPAATGLVDGVRVKTALALKVDDAAISTNGIAAGTDTSCAMPVALNRMILGSFQGSATFLNGTLRRLTYWPTRLPDSTLQAVTQ